MTLSQADSAPSSQPALSDPSVHLDTTERIAKWFCIAMALLLCLHAVRSYTYWDKGTHDHSVYWMAGERMAQGELSLYEAPEGMANLVGSTNYPPTFAALFAPLTFLPRPAGYALWALLQLVFIAASAGLLLRVPGARSWRLGAWVLLSLLWPLMANISAGQVNTLLALLCVAGWIALERGHQYRAAFLFALGAHIKLLPGVLLFWLLAQRRYKAALAMGLIGIALTLTPALWLIPRHGVGAGLSGAVQLHVSYAQRLAGKSNAAQGESSAGWSDDIVRWRKAEGNVALAGVAQRWFGESDILGAALLAAFALGLALVVGACFSSTRAIGPRGRLCSAGLCVVAATLANQVAWQAHLVLLALVLVPVMAGEHRRRGLVLAALAGYFVCSSLPPLLGYQLVLPAGVYDWTAWLQGTGLPTFAIVALTILALRRIRGLDERQLAEDTHAQNVRSESEKN